MKTNLRRIFFALLIAVLISGNLFQGSSAGGQTPAPVSKEEPQVGHNPDTGKVSFIGGGAPINVPGASGVRAASPEQKAMAAANIYGPQFGLRNPSQELQLSKTGEDGNGHAITRYQQVYQGIPVLAGEMIFNMNSNGDLLSVSGEVSSDLSLDTQPRISADEARRTAVGATAKWYKIDASSLTVSKPELQIFDESLLKASVLPPQLVWSMEVTATSSQPIREMVLVNAQTGAISLHINQIDTMGVTKPESQSPMPEPSLKAPPIPADIQGGAKVSNSPASNLAAGGATWYVATTGNDSNTCSTTSAPCLTINGALGKAASGDAINVASGTYTGTGFYVVTITKSIRILGGWDAAFTIQNGQSIIDGQASRSGIYINGTGLTVDISQFKVTNGGGSDGVAVYDKNTSGTTNFNRVALVSNQGNGIYNYAGNANFTNGTISGNHAGWAGSAISNVSGNINIQFSTITNNTGTFDYAIWSPNGGANIEIGSSILAGNNIGDCWANMTSDGYNIFGRLPACNNSFTLKPTDKVGTDPQISPLTGDGFHAISGSSPAITAANPATCPATDQRGIIRPYGTGCDIGAYEYTPAGTAAAIYPAGGSDQAVGLNQPSLSPLKAFVTDNIGAPVPGATVTFTAPALGASGIFSDSGTNTTTAITDNTGIATAATYTANELSGTYNIAA